MTIAKRLEKLEQATQPTSSYCPPFLCITCQDGESRDSALARKAAELGLLLHDMLNSAQFIFYMRCDSRPPKE
jgi:hypothetical protein